MSFVEVTADLLEISIKLEAMAVQLIFIEYPFDSQV